MTSNLVLATILMLAAALDTLLQNATRWMSAAFLMVIDIWVIVIVIGCIVIVIIIIVIRSGRRGK